MLEIYTDGACRNNGRPDAEGGWGVFIPSLELGYSGGEFGTTNNRMEMKACIEALRLAKNENFAPITVLTDSKYVVDGLTSWLSGWKKGGRFNPSLKNFDLWQELDALYSEVKPKLKWVRGHNGNAGNERADELSVFGIDNRQTLAHPNVKMNQKFGKGDKASPVPEPQNPEGSDLANVLQSDEDLTSLFDDFENESIERKEAGWEKEVIDLVVVLSKISEVQLPLNTKKALQTLKILTSLVTKAQEYISARDSGSDKQLSKAELALKKAQEKANAFISKPSVKKALTG